MIQRPMELRFPIGETLTYDLRLLGVHAGVARIAVLPPRLRAGRLLLPFVGAMKSEGLFSRLFKLVVDQHVYVDRHDLLPRFARVDFVRQSVKRDLRFTFSPTRSRVSTLLIDGGRRRKTYWHQIPKLTLDTLSSVYWIRCQSLALRSRLRFGLYLGRSPYVIEMVVRRRVLVSTPLGTYHTLALEGWSTRYRAGRSSSNAPKPKTGDGFRIGSAQRLTTFWLYVTDDHQRIPVKASFQSRFGTGEALLSRVEIKRYK
ncbi:MAG: DUF3108 domain-containing protein [Myxococcales bacterium]|nr:DUF3108 domain-containing protein [Myxococcales bacterium]